jgi:hypothetical protein
LVKFAWTSSEYFAHPPRDKKQTKKEKIKEQSDILDENSLIIILLYWIVTLKSIQTKIKVGKW